MQDLQSSCIVQNQLRKYQEKAERYPRLDLVCFCDISSFDFSKVTALREPYFPPFITGAYMAGEPVDDDEEGESSDGDA
nr:hypothetical protein Iba_chr14fCG2030 [Ipomoea batatas]